MGKIIKDFNTTAEMQNYVRTAEGGKSYLLRDKSGEDGIGTTLTSGKRIVAYKKNYHDYLTFTAEEANSTITGNLKHSTSIEYSYDGTTWSDANNVTITLANVGDSVMYRGEVKNNTTSSSSFSMTGKIAASGSIMSMLHGNSDDTEIDMNNAFRSMFNGCSSLTSAPELLATTLTENCYYQMFSGCTSLTTAPELPATTLARECYDSMFKGCTSLTSAPELPATTLGTSCYSNMFNGCTSLTQAPELPSTTLVSSCYGFMFNGCTSLTTAPSLPATTLVNYCYYQMFSGCTSLTTAPELPATTLAYECYSSMFQGCSSLNDVTINITHWNTSYASNWLSGVAATGTLHNLGEATNIPTNSANGCPTGWTLAND